MNDSSLYSVLSDATSSSIPDWGMAAIDARRKRSAERVAALAFRRQRWIESNRYFYASLARLLRHLVGTGQRVLVLRSETGELLRAVQPSVGVGMEISGQMIEAARQTNPQFRYLEGFPDGADFKTLFQATERFDHIIVNQVNDLVQVEALLENISPLCERHTRV